VRNVSAFVRKRKNGGESEKAGTWSSDMDTHIVATLHAGFHYNPRNPMSIEDKDENESKPLTVPGWKSDIEKQIFLSGWNRPEGVIIYVIQASQPDRFDRQCRGGGVTLIPGGLNGYSGGNMTIPWYSPPANGESGGPRCSGVSDHE
jgi:hypothetical protein